MVQRLNTLPAAISGVLWASSPLRRTSGTAFCAKISVGSKGQQETATIKRPPSFDPGRSAPQPKARLRKRGVAHPKDATSHKNNPDGAEVQHHHPSQRGGQHQAVNPVVSQVGQRLNTQRGLKREVGLVAPRRSSVPPRNQRFYVSVRAQQQGQPTPQPTGRQAQWGCQQVQIVAQPRMAPRTS